MDKVNGRYAATISTSTANDCQRTPGTGMQHTRSAVMKNDVDVAQFLVCTRDADSWCLSDTSLKVWVRCPAVQPRLSEGWFTGSMEYLLVTALGKIHKSDNRWWHKCVFF